MHSFHSLLLTGRKAARFFTASSTTIATCAAVVVSATFAPAQTLIQLPDSLYTAGDTIAWVKRIPTFCEGPAWDPAAQAVYFTRQYGNGQANWPIYKVRPGLDTGDVFIATAAQANGLELDAEGRLVAAQNGKLTRYKADGSVDTVLVTSGTNGVTFNQANDLSIGSSGAIYFTALGAQVYYLNPAGQLSVAYNNATSANGIEWVEADSAVYVNESRQVKRYKVGPDGALSDPQTFITVAAGSGGTYADGGTIDAHGNRYIANFQLGEIRIYNANGDSIGRIVPRLVTGTSFDAFGGNFGNASNIAFGGADMKTMFFTGDGGLFSLRMKIPGAVRHETPTSIHAVRPVRGARAAGQPAVVVPGMRGGARDLRGRLLPASRENNAGRTLRLPATPQASE